MYKCNDCIKLTKDYLKNLNYREQALKNIDLDIKELETELADVPISISKYSTEPNGGTSELNAVESMTYSRDKKADELRALKRSREKLSNHLSKMKYSIQCLSEDEQNLLELIYDKRLTLMLAGEKLGYSERTCARRLNDAVTSLASMFFGSNAYEAVYFIRQQ